MKDFFNVTPLERVREYAVDFSRVAAETVGLHQAHGRVLAADVVSDDDLPAFKRATMDGYAVRAASTFGASEANPAYLTVVGDVDMGVKPDMGVNAGEAVRIATGGMLPNGTDAVVMIEHTADLDETAIEVYRSVAPGQHIIEKGEDFNKDEVVLAQGTRVDPQSLGLLAAFGCQSVKVFRRPTIGILSTGDEIVSVEQAPKLGQIRDVNTYTLAGLVEAAGSVPITYGIVADDLQNLRSKLTIALDECDMVLISGGSSVGTRDYTIEAFSGLPQSQILVHGMTIRPGKPTILARIQGKAFWGLPGQVTSAMVVFTVVVRPFIDHIGGRDDNGVLAVKVPARLQRNVASAHGRIDYIRVRLTEKAGVLTADPILGKSGLLNTMVKADGLIAVDMNTEGLEKGAPVEVILV